MRKLTKADIFRSVTVTEWGGAAREPLVMLAFSRLRDEGHAGPKDYPDYGIKHYDRALGAVLNGAGQQDVMTIWTVRAAPAG